MAFKPGEIRAIIVKKPITTNGRDPLMVNGVVQYNTSYLSDNGLNNDTSTRFRLERHNKTKPQHLKTIVEEEEPDAKQKKSTNDKNSDA